ncbi:hypothetical protein SDC9_158995 [bioreactor metagenome]|uniref:Uncharacterized protein n=1 Tax=bioreactor metagenome TaxID=1076179 RepID=A0A645FBE8_9ZZZZ
MSTVNVRFSAVVVNAATCSLFTFTVKTGFESLPYLLAFTVRLVGCVMFTVGETIVAFCDPEAMRIVPGASVVLMKPVLDHVPVRPEVNSSSSKVCEGPPVLPVYEYTFKE